jgi:hypothetical protein
MNHLHDSFVERSSAADKDKAKDKAKAKDLPWWEILIIENQSQSGQSAVVLRMHHHCLADGYRTPWSTSLKRLLPMKMERL